MSDEQKRYHQLAVDYFNGTLDVEKEPDLFSWLTANRLRYSLFREWEAEWCEQCSPELQLQWQTMDRRITMKFNQSHRGEKRWNKKNRFRVYPYAAMFILALLAGFLLLTPKEKEEQYYLVEAPGGERSRVILPDNTLVWLNSGSSLKISDRYNKEGRSVVLEGEGYFEVTPNEHIPFVVSSGVCKIIVLGTRFNVSAYPDDPYIRTAVIDGKVNMSYGSQSVSLLKGQVLDFDKSDLHFMPVTESCESVVAWKDNRFEYDGIKLEELASRLSREYGVTVHFLSNKHLNDRFNISLRNKETLSDVVLGLKKIVPFEVKIQNDTIYID